MKKPVDHTDPNSQREYFEYIQTISWRGKFYKNFYLYPRINKILKGVTLDIGCGNGDFLKTRPGSVGCDVNPFNTDYCNEIGLEAYHYVNYPLKFNDLSFDSIFLDNVLEHIEDPSDLLIEARRVLKDKGIFLIGVPTLRGFKNQVDHKIFYDEKNLKKLLSDFGFIQKDAIYMPFKSKFLERNLNAHCLYASFIKENN